MKPVVFTSAILSFAVVVYTPEVNANSIPYDVSNAVTEQNINMVEGDNHTSISSKSSQDATTNTNYQFTSGNFLLYLFFLLICLMLLFQLWLDFDLARAK